MPQRIRVAFTSCSKLSGKKEKGDKVQVGWDRIRELRPDLLLLLGDQIYSNNNESDIESLKRKYEARRLGLPRMWRCINGDPTVGWAGVPFLSCWDDHDFGRDNAFGHHHSAAYKSEAAKLFDKYQVDRRPNRPWKVLPTTGRQGIYAAYDYEHVRIVMLDVRTHRTKPEEGGATLLGTAQEEWLRQQLDAQRSLTIVCSGTPLTLRGIKRVRGQWRWGGWMEYPGLVERFRGMISQGQRVIFLSGDMHRNGWRVHPEMCYEFAASPIGRRRSPKGRALNNFGILDISEDRVAWEMHGRVRKDRNKNTIRW